MSTSDPHDQDAEPPTPDGQPPDRVESDGGVASGSGQGDGDEPASHPDPEPGADHGQAGTDS